MLPITGNYMAGRDAFATGKEAIDLFKQGRYGKAALTGGLAKFSALGSVMPWGWGSRAATKDASTTLPAIMAYHGSPHKFDRFDMSKVGTGEGAQNFGHGLYFAENPAVANIYRDNLGDVTVNGNPVDSTSRMFAVAKLKGTLGDREADLRTQLDKLKAAPHDQPGRDLMRSKTEEMLAKIEEIRNADVKTTGSLYKTELDVEPHQLLDWDKPLSQQSSEVRAAFEKLAASHPNEFRRPEIQGWLNDDGGFMTGERAYDTLAGDFGGREAFAQTLREAGIPGIRYLDQGSRGAGQGTSNYVIFDDRLTKILGTE